MHAGSLRVVFCSINKAEVECCLLSDSTLLSWLMTVIVVHAALIHNLRWTALSYYPLLVAERLLCVVLPFTYLQWSLTVLLLFLVLHDFPVVRFLNERKHVSCSLLVVLNGRHPDGMFSPIIHEACFEFSAFANQVPLRPCYIFKCLLKVFREAQHHSQLIWPCCSWLRVALCCNWEGWRSIEISVCHSYQSCCLLIFEMNHQIWVQYSRCCICSEVLWYRRQGWTPWSQAAKWRDSPRCCLQRYDFLDTLPDGHPSGTWHL